MFHLYQVKAAKIAIDGMLNDKVIILPNNMKASFLLSKIVPTKLILSINSKVQERAE